MKIDVKLAGLSRVRLTCGEVILPELVSLSFSSSVYALDTLVGEATKGEKTIKFKTSGEEIDISSLCSCAGVIDVTVSLVCRGKSVKTWIVEPIYLKEIEHVMIATPETDELKQRLSRLETAVVELSKLTTESL